MKTWRADSPETVHPSGSKIYKTASSMDLITETSEGVSFQLHGGIMRAARRVLLDEIIGNIISEFVTRKKSQKHLKVDLVNQATKSCSSDGKTVMFFCSSDGKTVMFFLISIGRLYNFQTATLDVDLFLSN